MMLPGGCGSYHALQAVGEQQHDAVLPDPLGLTRADELVDDALGRVVEVPELGLPQDQGLGTGHGEAQLETCTHREREGEEPMKHKERGRSQ